MASGLHWVALTAATVVVVLACASTSFQVAAAQKVLLYDNFTTSCPPNADWIAIERQWGGTVNGGTNPANVACKFDATAGKQVLVLTSHGDKFTGSGPVGINKDGTPRSASQEWTDWKYPPTAHSCAPYCNVQRVGGGIETRMPFTEGTFEIRMKPCPMFGTASAAFVYNWTEVTCGSPLKPNVQNKCSPAYTAQCCRDGNCTINPNGKTGDVCRGIWTKNDEIDIEIPSSLETGPGSVVPSNIAFTNTRLNSVTAVVWTYKHHTLAGVDPPYSSSNFLDLGFQQNDGNYHVYKFEWVTSTSVNFWVDDKLYKTITGSKVVPEFGRLVLAAWFPNAWAGTPDFDTCEMMVDYVKITSNS